MKDKLTTILAIGIIMFIVFIIIFIPAYFLQRVECMKKYEEYQPSFSVFAGCRVMWSGKLTPVDIIREI